MGRVKNSEQEDAENSVKALAVEEAESHAPEEKARAKAPRRARQQKIDLERLRKEIRRRVGSESERIVKALIEAAKAGNVTQAKYLFEIIGLYPAAATEEETEQETMVSTLLKRLGLPVDEVDEPEEQEQAQSMAATVK